MPKALIGTRIKAPQGLLSIIPLQRLRKCSLLERADPDGCFIVQENFGVLDPIPWNPALAETAGRQ
jgi:urea transport system substrate-binding protein